MDCEDIEKILKDILIDSGVSADVPSNASGTGPGFSGDRIAALEGKLARLESRPNTNRVDKDPRDRKKTHDKPMIRGLDVCWDFNSKHGCKRPTIPGGCKTDKREFAHACNIWVKAKSAYCLMPHGRKFHK